MTTRLHDFFEHFQHFLRETLSIEFPLDKSSTRSAQVPTKTGIIHHLSYRFRKRARIFWKNSDSGSRFLQELLALAANAEDYWPACTHRFEHLRWNDVLENRTVLEKNKGHIAQPPTLLYFFLVHRTDEYDVIEPATLGVFFKPMPR